MGNDDDIIIRHKLVAAVKGAVTKRFALPVWALVALVAVGFILAKVF